MLAIDPSRDLPPYAHGNIENVGFSLPEAEGFPSGIPPIGLAGHYYEHNTGLVYMHHRWYSPRLGTFLTPDFRPPKIYDPSTFTEPYAYAKGNPLMCLDPNGLIGIFLDGTWNDEQQMDNDTNVYLLRKEYKGEAEYFKGVGTGGFLDKWISGLTGLGGESITEQAYSYLVKAYNAEYEKMLAGDPKADLSIDIFGFSRGAAEARDLANMINERGIPILSSGTTAHNNDNPKFGSYTHYSKRIMSPKIRFLGLFDTVGSVGLPGDESDPGYNLSIPENVEFARQATAMDEFRPSFPLSSILDSPNSPMAEGGTSYPRLLEKGFRGAHSDIGGGYQKKEGGDQLAKVSLEWMWDQATGVGVPFKELPKEHRPQRAVKKSPEKFIHNSLGMEDYILHQILGKDWDITKRKIYYPNSRKKK